MTSARPPVPRRWEYLLAVALLGLGARVHLFRRAGADAAVSALTGPGPDDPASDGPAPDEQTLSDRTPSDRALRRAAERAAHPWLMQVDRERAVGEAVLALWLAGRSYQLERAARRLDPS